MNAEASDRLPTAYLPSERDMLKCEHCASHNVRWFTPRSYAERAAVLLCMSCRRLTIVPPHARRAERQVETRQAA